MRNLRILISCVLALQSVSCAGPGKQPQPNLPPVAVIGGPYSAQVSQVVSFDASKSSDPQGYALTFSWQFGDGSNGTGAKPTHTYAVAGIYHVRLTITDVGGASSQATTLASIQALPGTPPVAATADRVINDFSGQPVVKDEVLVVLDARVSDPDQTILEIAQASGGVLIGGIKETLTYQVQYSAPDLTTLENLRSTVSQMQNVIAAVLHYVSRQPLLTIPNDPYYQTADSTAGIAGNWDEQHPAGAQWHLEVIKALSAWDVTTGDRAVQVGIIDLGFDPNHEDLRFNILSTSGPPRDPTSSHGTHVAGLACAEGNNGIGVAGVAWNCSLRLYNPENPGGAAFEDPMLVAQTMVQAALDGARVVNMSLGFIDTNQCGLPGDSNTLMRVASVNAILGAAVQFALRANRDVLWMFAAGNECRDAQFQSPASLVSLFPANTITVAATRLDGSLASYSNNGSLPSVAAPGGDFAPVTNAVVVGQAISSTLPNNSYGELVGTSMAAPLVTGVAALVFSKHPSLDSGQVKTCIVGNAHTAVPGSTFRIVDAAAAVNCPTVITVTKIGNGSGAITSGPGGIDCGPNCSTTMPIETLVVLTAVPSAGSMFVGWGGDCAGSAPVTTLTLMRNMICSAEFESLPPNVTTLSIAKKGTGVGTVTSTPPGINCGLTCTATFANQTTLSVVALPATGSVFVGWSGDCTGTSNTTTVVLSVSKTCVADFESGGQGVPVQFQRSDYAVGSNPVAVAVGDFNGDGKPDLAIANFISGTVSIFLNNGDGTFQAKAGTGIDDSFSPSCVVSGDFNNDQKTDLIVCDANRNLVYSYAGNSDGTFQRIGTTTVGVQPRGAVAGDFNGDGNLDIAVANSGSPSAPGNSVSILIGNGAGGFVAHSEGTAGIPVSLAVGDFNGDGKLDLVAAAEVCSFANCQGSQSSISTLLGNGDGTFQPHVDYPVLQGPGNLSVGDFDEDGHTDLAIPIGGTLGLPSSVVALLFGNGDGTTRNQTNVAVGSGPVGTVVGDFNGDGIPDLAVVNQNDNTVSILIGVGDGTFQGPLSFGTPPSPTAVAAADLNGDGLLDFVVVGGGTLSVFLNTTKLSSVPVPVPPTMLTLEPSIIFGGQNSVARVTLAAPAATDETITLASDNPEATIQNQVTIHGGSSSTTALLSTSTVSSTNALAIHISATFGPKTVTSVLTVQPTPAPGLYRVVDIGAPVINGIPVSVIGYGVNDVGAVVGPIFWPCCINPAPYGSFVWQAGVFTFLPDQFGAINDAGELGGACGKGYPCIWQNGQSTNLSSSFGNVNGIDSDGDAAGLAGLSAFLWGNGTLQNLGNLGAVSSDAIVTSIAAGVAKHRIRRGDVAVTLTQVVGEALTANFTPHAFSYESPTGMRDLGTLGGSRSYAVAVNGGIVVGWANTANDASSHAFIVVTPWSPNDLVQMQDINPSGALSSQATSVNLSGQVVGGYSDGIEARAFIWQLGSAYDLNGLIPPGSGWRLHVANWISDNGFIVGLGEFQGNRSRPFLLVPVK